MKTLFLITILFMLCISSMAQEMAYLVSYDSAGVIIAKKCYKIEEVEKIMNEKFQKFKTDGVFFDLYVEKKRIAKNGKLKRIKHGK